MSGRPLRPGEPSGSRYPRCMEYVGGKLRRFVFFGAWLLVAPIIGIYVDLAPQPWSHVATPAALLCLIPAVRAWRSGLGLGPDGIRIRRVWSTRTVPREQVTGLTVRDSWTLRFDSCVAVVLTGGRVIKVPVVGAGAFDKDDLRVLEDRMRSLSTPRLQSKIE